MANYAAVESVSIPIGILKSGENLVGIAATASAGPASIGLKLIGEGVFGDRLDDRAHVIAVYEKNNADVQAAFTQERLLTYNLGDGWEPLCRFLGEPVPDMPFPRSNPREQFDSMMAEAQRLEREWRPK